MSTPLVIEEPPQPPTKRFALWEIGFRPFYLLASSFAALSIALWAMQFSGLLGRPYLAGPLWHAHEMVFGFTLAVMVGFLFTAGRNWSNLPTPSGVPLAALAALWIAARVLVLTPWGWAAAVANVAFPIAAAVSLAIPFVRAKNKRNYFFVALLALLGIASGLVHASQLRMVALPAWVGIQVALDVVLFIVVVMGGRVIPMFTNNGVPGSTATRKPLLERASLGLVLALLAADALGAGATVVAVIAASAAVAHLARWTLWQPWRTLRVPLVWVLHVAYLWIPVHLALRALSGLGWVSSSFASHALTVGAIGGLIIGMMTRTARGHTARPLRADGFDTSCYVLVLSAGAVRVLLPWAEPEATMWAIQASSALWSAGFTLYTLRYWSVLTRPRLDGRPG
jgi:uncharacterized protein involved in response to NO